MLLNVDILSTPGPNFKPGYVRQCFGHRRTLPPFWTQNVFGEVAIGTISYIAGPTPGDAAS